jgi:hypothetical protein
VLVLDKDKKTLKRGSFGRKFVSDPAVTIAVPASDRGMKRSLLSAFSRIPD